MESLISYLQIIVTGAAVLAIIRGNASVRRIEPNPLRVKEATRYATAAELQRLDDEVEALARDLPALRKEIVDNGEKRRVAIEAKVESARHELSDEIKNVHERINNILTAVATLQGSLTKTK